MSTTTTTFQPGDLVFNREGREAQYIALSEGGHIVRPGFFHNDDLGTPETHYEGVVEWRNVYAKPPTDKLHAEIGKLTEEIAALNVEYQTVRAAKLALDREIKNRADRVKQHEQLAQLDDYLAGRITHFVVKRSDYSHKHVINVSVETFKDALTKSETWNRGKLKTLALYGDSKSDLTWGINEYRNSHGDGTTVVVPCTSIEQARQIAVGIYEEHLAAWRADPNARDGWGTTNLIEHAKRFELPVPADVVAAMETSRLAGAAATVENARKALLKAEAELQSVQAGLPELPSNTPRSAAIKSPS